jgi:hypothetical protein
VEHDGEEEEDEHDDDDDDDDDDEHDDSQFTLNFDSLHPLFFLYLQRDITIFSDNII